MAEQHPVWWRLAVPVLAILAAAAVVEIILRSASADSEERFFVADAERGWALRPGFKGWYTGENRVWVEINSRGMRDREHALRKEQGTVRVAVLGDSYMQGINVPLHKTFPSFLEAKLGECHESPVEVLNFGVSGYGTAQQLITYRRDASRYTPDVVLLAFYTGNDVHNNHPALNPSVDRDRSVYLTVRDGKLQLMPPAEARSGGAIDARAATRDLPLYQRWRLAITERSRAADVLYGWWGRLRAKRDPSRHQRSPVQDAIYSPPEAGPFTEAWLATEAMLLALHQEATSRGSEFWLVTLANAEQLDPDVTRRAAFARTLGVTTLLYPDHRLREFAGRNGLPVITLAEPMAEHAAITGEYLNGGYTADEPSGSGHWNEAANELAAGMVAGRLCRDSEAFAPDDRASIRRGNQ